MKTNKLFAMLVLVCAGMYTAKAQKVIVADSFRNKAQAPDTTISVATTNQSPGMVVAFPKGWNTDTKYNNWTYNSFKTGGVDKGGNVTFAFAVDINTSHIPFIGLDTPKSVISPKLCSTMGFKSVKVSWAERVSGSWPADGKISVYWSTDSSAWNLIYDTTSRVSTTNYQVCNNDTGITLPSSAAGASKLYLKWTAKSSASGGNYQFSDVVVTGTGTATGINDVLYTSSPKVTTFSANNLLHLQFSNTNGAEAMVSVYDMDGKNMLSENMASSSDQTINISNFASGIYTARVIIAGQAFTTKFAK